MSTVKTTPKQYTPLALANTFIDRHGHNAGIGHMKLQKLCYYAYGWWLASHNDPLLTDAPEVWQYGPVFGTLYKALRGLGGEPILRPVPDLLSASSVFSDQPLSAPKINDEEVLSFIDAIWGMYGQYTAVELSNMTHRKGTPWQTEAEKNNYSVPKHYQIPDDVIKNYFRNEDLRKEQE
jgi:uncharacterized phage-associated protein